MTADDIIRILELQPHPEGGAFRETYRCPSEARRDPPRSCGTSIYFLLRGGEVSRWHRVVHDEMYFFHAGHPLELSLISPVGVLSRCRLGIDLDQGNVPQLLVPARYWQSARSEGAYTLAGCTVTPGFDYHDFEMIDTEQLLKQFPHLHGQIT